MGLSLAIVLLALTAAGASGKRTTTKTKLDIRVVRSPQHAVDAHSAYVLTSQHQQQAKAAEEEAAAAAAAHQVSLITEAQYEALLKQAQKALQGYDLTKLSAVAHGTPVPPVVVERKPPQKVYYKPAVKYVYNDAATSVSYNSAPIHSYGGGSVAYHTSSNAYHASAPVSTVAYKTAIQASPAPVVSPYLTSATPTSTYGASYTHSQSTDEDHEPDYDHYSKHKFGYRVHDPHTGAAFGHSEVSEGHVTRGHYHVLLPDGRLQNVKYVADPSGYHATVTYENYKHY